ncbi:MAG TPA: sigma-54-dependent Fis family transcriptional regulator [Caldithrix abyssi]|uniref:Sigma-54-dependent Fis family transcriptional regulator n=1 Tax=Caldithrix abyssi TaxID=187145 RepID=A0A7V4TZF5_CALAY|nr:sigma-54-dependent Fis family transcriptional regulator [Caldithrix abyssi]
MKNEDIKILVVDDEEIVRESLTGWFEEDGYTVDNAKDAVEALNKMTRTRWDIYFVDIKMPGMDGLELQRRIREIDNEAIVIIITAYASVDTAVQALKEGAFDYITKPFDPDQLSRLIRNAAKQRRLSLENKELKGSLEQLITPPEIIGSSQHTEEIKKSIEVVAPTNTTVMIRGESGTGKELVARAIHAHSDRRYFPLVTVNCGALSDSLLESELFGHEKGAFTGALYRRKGKLEIANGGTLFLDEVGTIGPKTQVDLLRAIESKEFTRLGGNETIRSDFRIICATNTNLEEAVKEMKFREDLYYRLQVYVIQLKPLRERPEDIPELVNYFIRRYSQKMNKPIKGIDREALDMLMAYSWPGNIRELENAVEAAMVVTKGPSLQRNNFKLNHSDQPLVFSSDLSLAEVEKNHILNVLQAHNWNITTAAKLLGIDRVTIYKKLRKYGIQRPKNA